MFDEPRNVSNAGAGKNVHYYQISLTGRQMVAAFVSAIVLLAAAFLFGFKTARTGRNDSAIASSPRTSAVPSPNAAPETTAAVSPGPATSAAAIQEVEAGGEAPAGLGEVAPDSSATEEAKISPEKKDAGRESESGKSPDGTAAKKSENKGKSNESGRDPSRGSPPKTMEAAPRPAKQADHPVPVPPGARSAEAQAKSTPAKPIAEKPATPKSAAADVKKTPPPNAKKGSDPKKPAEVQRSSSGSFTVQVGALKSVNEAETLRKRLADRGYTVTVSVIEVSGKKLNRVRVGSFKTHEDAERMADRLKGAEKYLKAIDVVPR